MVSKKASKSLKTSKTTKESTTLDTITVETDELAPTSPIPPPPAPAQTDPFTNDLSSDSEKGEAQREGEEEEEEEEEAKREDGPRISWSLEMYEALIEFILECHRDGKTSGGGMKKELWYLAAIRVNKAARGFTVPWDKCKNKWTSDIKEKWKHWVMLSEMSGFGWHDEKELYEADNDVWQRLNKAYPRVI
jgi:Myb/SANT-like DNA-binding domain